MRALITGIGGFAGSHLAEYLLGLGDWEVWGLVYASYRNIAHIQDRLRLLEGDARDREVVTDLLRRSRPDHIYHLAGQAFVPSSWKDPWATLETNIKTQLNILQVTVDLGLEAKILVVGSNEEYGQIRPDELPVKETNPLRPDSPYGVSKIAQDMLGLQYYLSHGLHTVRVRPFNHLGPRQSERFVAPAFAKQMAEIEAGLRPPVLRVGNLTPQRDFTDVRDVVRGYHLAVSKGEPGEVYNIGSEVACPIQRILDLLLDMGDVSVSVEEDPARFRPSDVPVSVSDCSKFRRQTGWRPEIPLEKSLGDVLDYWRMQVKEVKRFERGQNLWESRL
ncbi:MAG: GDP-mannose 4,6-dehydratase [Anaerolineae bacterium]